MASFVSLAWRTDFSFLWLSVAGAGLWFSMASSCLLGVLSAMGPGTLTWLLPVTGATSSSPIYMSQLLRLSFPIYRNRTNILCAQPQQLKLQVKHNTARYTNWTVCSKLCTPTNWNIIIIQYNMNLNNYKHCHSEHYSLFKIP